MLKGEIADTKNMSSLRNMSGIDIRQKSRKNKKKTMKPKNYLTYVSNVLLLSLMTRLMGTTFLLEKFPLGEKVSNAAIRVYDG